MELIIKVQFVKLLLRFCTVCYDHLKWHVRLQCNIKQHL